MSVPKMTWNGLKCIQKREAGFCESTCSIVDKVSGTGAILLILKWKMDIILKVLLLEGLGHNMSWWLE